MRNVLNGRSNGQEKDRAWAWKKDPDQRMHCTTEFRSFDEDEEGDREQARL
jgi:hypothetical protein